MSPVTISQSTPSRLVLALEGLARARTIAPRAARERRTAEPTNPVAPVTSTLSPAPIVASLMEIHRAAPVPSAVRGHLPGDGVALVVEVAALAILLGAFEDVGQAL